MTHHHHTASRTSDLGFTLVEVVLYMAFTTVILLISGAYLLDVLQMKTRLQTVRSLTQGSYVLQHILEGQIDQAVTILSPSRSETVNALVLSDGLSTTSIGVSAGVVVLTISANEIPLTPRDIEVRDLQFTQVGAVGAPEAIRTEGSFCARQAAPAAPAPVCIPFHWLFTRQVTP